MAGPSKQSSKAKVQAGLRELAARRSQRQLEKQRREEEIAEIGLEAYQAKQKAAAKEQEKKEIEEEARRAEQEAIQTAFEARNKATQAEKRRYARNAERRQQFIEEQRIADEERYSRNSTNKRKRAAGKPAEKTDQSTSGRAKKAKTAEKTANRAKAQELKRAQGASRGQKRAREEEKASEPKRAKTSRYVTRSSPKTEDSVRLTTASQRIRRIPRESSSSPDEPLVEKSRKPVTISNQKAKYRAEPTAASRRTKRGTPKESSSSSDEPLMENTKMTLPGSRAQQHPKPEAKTKGTNCKSSPLESEKLSKPKKACSFPLKKVTRVMRSASARNVTQGTGASKPLTENELEDDQGEKNSSHGSKDIAQHGSEAEIVTAEMSSIPADETRKASDAELTETTKPKRRIRLVYPYDHISPEEVMYLKPKYYYFQGAKEKHGRKDTCHTDQEQKDVAALEKTEKSSELGAQRSSSDKPLRKISLTEYTKKRKQAKDKSKDTQSASKKEKE